MSNMTIENVGSFIRSGDSDRAMNHERLTPAEAPNVDINGLSGGIGEHGGGHGGGQGSFIDVLKKGMDTVNKAQSEADIGVKEAVAGRNRNIHETMLLLEKADMTFKMAMQVRNKIIDAYREVMKMQI